MSVRIRSGVIPIDVYPAAFVQNRQRGHRFLVGEDLAVHDAGAVLRSVDVAVADAALLGALPWVAPSSTVPAATVRDTSAQGPRRSLSRSNGEALLESVPSVSSISDWLR